MNPYKRRISLQPMIKEVFIYHYCHGVSFSPSPRPIKMMISAQKNKLTIQAIMYLGQKKKWVKIVVT